MLLSPGRTPLICTALFPADSYADGGKDQQADHSYEDCPVAAGKIIDKSVGRDQHNGGNRGAHRNFGKYLFIIGLPIKFEGKDWSQDHDAGSHQTVEKG